VNDGGNDAGEPRPPGEQPAPANPAPANPALANPALANPALAKPALAKPAGEAARFTAEEEKQLRAVVQGGELPECPRCHVRMTRRPIGGGSFGLGYHRQREWLLCPSCRRSAIFDVKRGTRL
jgi:hypothetical protein